jgi:hypothetical protein
LLVTWVVATLPSACGGGGAEGEDLLAEACEHMQDGPFEDVTAAADRAAALPDVTYEHTSVRVALVDVAGGRGGFVAFRAAAAAGYVFFLSANVAFGVSDAAGAPVTLEQSRGDLGACAEVSVEHTVALEVGTWTLSLGPTSETTVSLVIEEEGGAHEGEH